MRTFVNIAVTGANGQLGMELRELAPHFPQLNFHFLTRHQLPVDDAAAIETFLQGNDPDLLINCAAYTSVDKAESDKETAWKINAAALREIGSATAKKEIAVIHFSTDYIFDGEQHHPYDEHSVANPLNEYGKSKYAGEKFLISQNPDSMIIRTSWVYSSYGKNFVKTMLKLMSERQEISVVNDQRGSPTYARDLASAVLEILGNGKFKPGIYNYCNEGIITWFDFANAIRDSAELRCRITGMPTSGYPTPARRSLYSVLDTAKFKEDFGLNIPEWRQSLNDCLAKIKAQK